MNPLNLDEVREYVNENIDDFHESRVKRLSNLTIREIIHKNPYLFRAKNILIASDLVKETLSAFLSSSEEKQFGDFLEGLAVFVAEKTIGGMKSASPGVDLEFVKNGVHFIVSIKSGPNWGNSSQWAQLGQNLSTALVRVKQGIRVPAEAVLGICYGKTRTVRNSKHGYLKIVGQNFWTFISGNRDLYIEIIEPLGYRAKEHNDFYLSELARVTNLLTRDVLDQFCDASGVIDWEKLVKASSSNFDLDRIGLVE